MMNKKNMNDKAQKLLESYDYILSELPYYYPQKARAIIHCIVSQLETAIRIGYEDFAKALTIVLVRAVRTRRGK